LPNENFRLTIKIVKFFTTSALIALMAVLFFGDVQAGDPQAQLIELLNNYTNAVEPSLIIKNSGGGTNNGAIVTSTIVAQAFGLSTNDVVRVPFINMTQTSSVSNLRIAIYGNQYVNGQAVPNLTNRLINYLPSLGTNSRAEIQAKIKSNPFYTNNLGAITLSSSTNFLYTATFKADEINYSKVNTNNLFTLVSNTVVTLSNEYSSNSQIYINTTNAQTLIKTGASNGVLYLNTLQPTTNPYWIVYALVGSASLALDAVTSETNSGSNPPYIGDALTTTLISTNPSSWFKSTNPPSFTNSVSAPIWTNTHTATQISIYYDLL